MKTILCTFAALVLLADVRLHSQAPGAAPVPAQALSPLQQLQAIRDANVKLLEQQAKALQQLEEMQKTAHQIKMFGKRS